MCLGATKALKAFIAVPPAQRTPAIKRAIAQGMQFLLDYDLVQANYPATEQVSSTWFKLGFPLSYWSDVLETLTVLATLGCGRAPQVSRAYHWLMQKQDAQGRWTLENSLNGKMWSDIERKGRPSKWITLRAMRVIKAIEETPIST